MKTYLFLLFVLLGLGSKAQFLSDNNNRPITEKRYVNITGSPYFSDEFYPGTVVLSDGKKYDNLLIQLDEVRDAMLFKENKPDAKTLEFTTTPVLEFTLKTGTGNPVKFKNIAGADTKINGFCQILLEGKTSLLKKTKKSIIQNATYNTANIEKTIASSTLYALQAADQKVTMVKGDKKAFLKALADRSKEIEAYVNEQNIDFKNDADLVKLITYYNTL